MSMKSGRDVSAELAVVVLRFIAAILFVILTLSLCSCSSMPVPVCPEVTIKFCPV